MKMRHHIGVMETTDMRKLSPEARHERRVQVIRLRKAERTYDEIAQQTGLSRTGVFDICKRHDQKGAKGLHDVSGGRKRGEKRLLDATQEADVRRLIAEKTPDQLKMNCVFRSIVTGRFGIVTARFGGW